MATQLQHNTKLDIYNEPTRMRRSGIVCTIGPVSRSVEMLMTLMEAGLDVVRCNFSHGTHEYHTETIANAREAAKKLGRPITIALDTKGPEVRTGNFIDGKEVILTKGSKVRLSTNEEHHDNGTAERFYIDYKNIVKVIQKDNIVFIDDGLVALKVVEVGADFVDTVVVNDGPVSNHKGVNLSNVNVDLPALLPKDKADLALGVKLNVDMVFASFVRKQEDVDEIRQCLVEADPEIGKRIKIISKIENHEGVQKFDAILEKTDGVMVARGDLGIEIPPEKVFLAQKMMVSKCNIAGKPCIVATQMLESMIKNPRPTRAEVSDVANAVLDGADCVMLSGETAKGKWPVEAVTMMARICREAEEVTNPRSTFQQVRDSLASPLSTPDTVCCAAVLAAFEQDAKAIVVLTNSGDTARMVAKFRPPVPVIAVVGASCDFTMRQLAITRGVWGMAYDDSAGKKSADDRVQIGLEYGKKKGWIKEGCFVIAVHADTMGKGFANLVKVVVV